MEYDWEEESKLKEELWEKGNERVDEINIIDPVDDKWKFYV